MQIIWIPFWNILKFYLGVQIHLHNNQAYKIRHPLALRRLDSSSETLWVHLVRGLGSTLPVSFYNPVSGERSKMAKGGLLRHVDSLSELADRGGVWRIRGDREGAERDHDIERE